MEVFDLPLEQIIPYARNPRRNAEAIATVAALIQEFDWGQPSWCKRRWWSPLDWGQSHMGFATSPVDYLNEHDGLGPVDIQASQFF